jgi:hypothetical protein
MLFIYKAPSSNVGLEIKQINGQHQSTRKVRKSDVNYVSNNFNISIVLIGKQRMFGINITMEWVILLRVIHARKHFNKYCVLIVMYLIYFQRRVIITVKNVRVSNVNKSFNTYIVHIVKKRSIFLVLVINKIFVLLAFHARKIFNHLTVTIVIRLFSGLSLITR